MSKRSVGINVRVSVTEKRKMTLMAKRCGLSLSEYLRQRALGYEPGGHPPKEVFDVLDQHTNNKTRSRDSSHQRQGGTMAYIKKKSERKFKITVCNGYNWRKRTIHVQRGVVKLSHQESITKDPKTSSGDRMVYLSKEMCQLLKAWRKECEWDRQQTANETVDEDDYLFRQPNGKPMCPSTFTYRFKLILKANNLPLDLNVHSLRHTNASLLIAQGVDVRTVASLLGHAQASTTLDIYAHAFDKNKRKAQEKLGKAIGL